MKIAQVCPYDFFRAGGVQVHIDNLAEELKKKGHEVKIIAPGVKGVKSTRDDVILMGKSALMSFNKTQFEMSFAMGKVRNPVKDMLAHEKFDVIHFHEPWVPALSMQILSESTSINVGTFHGSSPKTFLVRSVETIFMPVARYIVNALDGVIAVSDAPAEFVREFYKGEIELIPNGVDLAVFNKRVKPFEKYKDGKINIFFIGRLDKRKGVKYLLKAFRELKSRYENVRLILGGKGEQLEKCKRYIKKHNLQDVEVLGYVDEEDKPRYFATCDIFCSPALYGESFGIVLVEAMAASKPVVACSNPGYRTVLKGRGALLLTEPKDTEGLAEKLEILCKDKELRNFMGEWGVEEAEQYSWESVSEKILGFYKKAASTRKSRKKVKAEKNIEEVLKKWFKRLGNELNGKY